MADSILNPAPTPTTKPGYKTTEFYLAAAAMLIGLLYMSGAINPDGDSHLARVVAFVAAALASLGYSISRGKAKSA